MAVRIAPIGSDLFVEWRHHVLPPYGPGSGTYLLAIVAVIPVLLAICGFLGLAIPELRDDPAPWFAILLGVVGYGVLFTLAKRQRRDSLTGFQSQDSTAFQLAVRAALEEAIDLAGISKALIQELPKEETKERRVI
jgi:uncharacterized membrane protein YbhN (UPF0104 family)